MVFINFIQLQMNLTKLTQLQMIPKQISPTTNWFKPLMSTTNSNQIKSTTNRIIYKLSQLQMEYNKFRQLQMNLKWIASGTNLDR